MKLRQLLNFPFCVINIDARRLLLSIRGLVRYFRQCVEYSRLKGYEEIDISFCAPCTTDWYDACGNIMSVYFIQDLYVASKINAANPIRHIDVGSRMDGFVAHVASFRNIEVIDIRSNPNQIPNVAFTQADFMKPLPHELVECCDSVSCLHALEHFGLGRYGDPLNFDGHLVGLENLWRILKKGGVLYLSVPIGPTRVEFNSQRIFSLDYLVEKIKDKFSIMDFSYIDDKCVLHKEQKLTSAEAAKSYGCKCGCGIFTLSKK